MAAKRPPPNRSTTASIFIRCQPEEKAALEAAAAKQAAELPGARLPVHRFVLVAALEKAKGLGFEPVAATEKRGKGGGR